MHCVMVDFGSMLQTKIYFKTGDRLIGIERKVLKMIHNFWMFLLAILLNLFSSAFNNYHKYYFRKHLVAFRQKQTNKILPKAPKQKQPTKPTHKPLRVVYCI